MIAGLVADRRKVEKQPVGAILDEAVDVGVVGNEPIGADRQAVGHGTLDIVLEQPDRGRVRHRRLEHVDRARRPPRLEVDQRVDPAADGIAVEEGARTDQPRFLALVEQEGDAANQWPVLHQCRRLQHRRDPQPGVARAGPNRHAVVMRIDQDMRRGRFGADGHRHVAHPRAACPARLVQLVAGKAVIDPGAEAHRAKLGHQPIAHPVAGRAVGGVGRLVPQHARQPRLGPRGVELARAIGLPSLRREGQPARRRHHRQEADHNQSEQSEFAHHVPLASAAGPR